MEIYVVKEGDTLYSIAKKYGVSVEKLIQDNGLTNSENLVTGQTIVITYPKQTHIVQEGETINSIATSYHVTTMQLLRNNPFLSEREYIYPGETLVISYNTIGNISVNGYSYPFIKYTTLIKTLPNLTYLSIFNYTTSPEGNIISYEDDSNIIEAAKDYGVIPLMLLTTLTSLAGAQNVQLAYRILLNKEFQDRIINQLIQILKAKGYQGVNFVFYYMNEDNQELYLSFVKKISKQLQQEGFLLFLTINYNISISNNIISITKIDYSKFSKLINEFFFIRFLWGINYDPPEPVSNINYIKELVQYVSSNVPANQINIGKPVIGYDWSLPYYPRVSTAYSLSIDSALKLASETNSIIQFDEVSQTPYFYYTQYYYGSQIQHIVWFIDARSLVALDEVIADNNLNGSGIWNIMIYNSQLWSIINAKFNIVKLIPDIFK